MFDIKQMLSLYFVAGSQDCRHMAGASSDNLCSILKQALASGITCFQLRDKGAFSLENDRPAQKALALRCREICREYGVPFIVNDDLALALEVDADGIHVGQTDIDPSWIRQQTNKPLIIGLSVNTLEQAKMAQARTDIDYCGIGPIFPTQSKADPKPVVGMEFIQTLRQNGITKPLVAIGGIKTAEQAVRLRQYNANGVAVISAITQAQDIAKVVRELLGN